MAIVGEAFVLIRPDTTPFMPELQAKMAGQDVAGAAALPGAAAGAAGATTAVATETEAAAAQTATAVEEGVARSQKAWNAFGKTAEDVSSKSGSQWTGFANLFSMNAGRITGGSNLVRDSLNDLDKAGLNASEGLEAAGTGMGVAVAGIAAAVLAVGGGAMAFTELGNQIFNLHERTGIASEDASRLTYAFNLMGVAPQTATVGLARFARNVESGTVDLQRYGVEVVRGADGTVQMLPTLLNLADAMERLGPGAQSTTLAIQALGRGGAALVPVLVQGRDALKGLMDAAPSGVIFSDEDAQRAHQFSVQLKEVKIDLQAIFVEIGRQAVPVLMDVAGWFDFVSRHAQTFITLFGGGWHALASVLDAFGISSGGASDSIDTTIKALQAQQAAADADSAAIERADQATKDLTDKMNKMADAAGSIIDNERAVTKAHEDRLAAMDAVTKAQADYDKLARAGGSDAKAYESATRSLTSAQEALARALHDIDDVNQSIHEKTLALAEATDLYGPSSEEARKATVDLSDANFRLGETNDSITKSRGDVAQALIDQSNAAAGSADSVQRLNDAHDKLTAAKRGVEDAVYAEATASAQLADNMDAVAGKTDTAQDKTLNLINALTAVRDSLAPDSPLRKNFDGWIAQLQSAYDAETRLNTQIAEGPAPQGERSAGYFAQQANTFNIYSNQDPTLIARAVDSYVGGGIGIGGDTSGGGDFTAPRVNHT